MVLSGISAMGMWPELTIPCKSQMRGERGSNKLYFFQNSDYRANFMNTGSIFKVW